MSRASGTLARLEKLSADHAARQARREALEKDGRGAALERDCLALCALLPDEERSEVEARGARGYADLLTEYWMSGNGQAGVMTAEDALSAYRATVGK